MPNEVSAALTKKRHKKKQNAKAAKKINTTIWERHFLKQLPKLKINLNSLRHLFAAKRTP